MKEKNNLQNFPPPDTGQPTGERDIQLEKEKELWQCFDLYKRQLTGAQCVVRSFRAIGKCLRHKLPAEVTEAVDELGRWAEEGTPPVSCKERFQRICEAEEELTEAFGKHLNAFSRPIQGLIDAFEQAQDEGMDNEGLYKLCKKFAKHLDGLTPYLDLALREEADQAACGFSTDVSSRRSLFKHPRHRAVNLRIFALVTFYRPACAKEITESKFKDILRCDTLRYLDYFVPITRRRRGNASIALLECGMSDSHAKAFRRFLESDETPPPLAQAPLCSYYDVLWTAYLYPNRDCIKYLLPTADKRTC